MSEVTAESPSSSSGQHLTHESSVASTSLEECRAVSTDSVAPLVSSVKKIILCEYKNAYLYFKC